MASFFPFHARWRVGHDLVLVFATTRKEMSLLTQPTREEADAILDLLKIQFAKVSYTV